MKYVDTKCNLTHSKVWSLLRTRLSSGRTQSLRWPTRIPTSWHIIHHNSRISIKENSRQINWCAFSSFLSLETLLSITLKFTYLTFLQKSYFFRSFSTWPTQHHKKKFDNWHGKAFVFWNRNKKLVKMPDNWCWLPGKQIQVENQVTLQLRRSGWDGDFTYAVSSKIKRPLFIFFVPHLIIPPMIIMKKYVPTYS